MNLKKIVFVFFPILILAGFTAQSQAQGVSFGMRAGFDLQKINGKDYDGEGIYFFLVPRFNVGGVLEIPVAPNFFFQPALLYSTKGGKTDSDLLYSEVVESYIVQGKIDEREYCISYLELPLSFIYKPMMGNGFLILGFGAYFSYGIAGKINYI